MTTRGGAPRRTCARTSPHGRNIRRSSCLSIASPREPDRLLPAKPPLNGDRDAGELFHVLSATC
jgi:hypothetical protein